MIEDDEYKQLGVSLLHALPVVALVGLLCWSALLSQFAAGATDDLRFAMGVVIAVVLPWAILFAITKALPSPKWVSRMALIVLGLCVASFWLPWTERRQFVARLRAVELGSSESQVSETMRPFLRVRRSVHSSAETELFFWWSDDAYDADVAIFTFSRGKLVAKRFSPD
ncbi:MAG TPA: hypothetical protein VK934_07320 [Fimbriimonas sp.]|nr:hypothetical protein [Fimbriimonas sp.]